MEISKRLYEEICETFQYTGCEKGGVLGISRKEIILYYLDEKETVNGNSYYPDGESLEQAIHDMAPVCDEIAFVHCHPKNWEQLSYADICFARTYLKLNKTASVYMALVVGKKIILYKIMASQERAVQEPLIFGQDSAG